MGIIFSFILFVVLIFYYYICSKAIEIFHLHRKKVSEENRFNNDILDIDDIYSLSPREFELWSGDFLERLGYEFVEYTELGPDGGKDIICKRKDEIIYVECKRYYYKKYAPRKISDIIVKKLLGAMVHDNVKKGVIITTGNVETSAIDFIETLTNDLSIRIIDWREILSVYNSQKSENTVTGLKLSEV